MDTKEYAEKIINNLDDYPFECGYVAEEYLTKCAEVERMKAQPTPCACLINDYDEYDRRCAFHRDKEQEARNNALEDAAKIAENDDTDCENAEHHVGCGAGFYIATAIRALKDKQ